MPAEGEPEKKYQENINERDERESDRELERDSSEREREIHAHTPQLSAAHGHLPSEIFLTLPRR
jgi:hypothetical protein